jgi:hypothetical protein
MAGETGLSTRTFSPPTRTCTLWARRNGLRVSFLSLPGGEPLEHDLSMLEVEGLLPEWHNGVSSCRIFTGDEKHGVESFHQK